MEKRNRKPFWKRYKLRWLFYRRVGGWSLPSPKTDKYISKERCSSCKWGVNFKWGLIFTNEQGEVVHETMCPHCGEDYKAEPNTNLSYRCYQIYSWGSSLFWTTLNKLHIVRSSINGRYDMFGDEGALVKYWALKDGRTEVVLRKRRWWEYILIEK